jgi:hypothetical protein
LKKKKQDLTKEKPAGTIEAGNNIYRVFVEDIPSEGVGYYSAVTGPDHPAGGWRSVLFGGSFGSPGTSFNTIRSYTTMTDYTIDSSAESEPPFTKFDINPFGTTFPIGTTGARTTYVLPGPPTTPDALIIVQDVNVIGTSFEDSYVLVRVEVTNNNNVDTRIGIRYLWDTIIGEDDGPTMQTILPAGNVLTNETEFVQPQFEAFQIADNDSNPNPPTFIVYGTAAGIDTINTGIPPSLIQYVSWFNSSFTAFCYTIDPEFNIASPPENDSAVLLYWGHNEDTAVVLDANGGSFSREAALFATRPGIISPLINNNICIKVNRIFDICRQEVTKTKTLHISSLKYGTLLGCRIKQSHCSVIKTSEPDTVSGVKIQVALNVEYRIKVHGRIIHILKPIYFTATANLAIPEGSSVSCEIQNPTCESTVIEGGKVQTTVNAFIQLESSGIDRIVIPFVAGCPIGLCPVNTNGAEAGNESDNDTDANDGKADDVELTDSEKDTADLKDES